MRDTRKRFVAISRKTYEDLLAKEMKNRARSNFALALSFASMAISFSCLVFLCVNL